MHNRLWLALAGLLICVGLASSSFATDPAPAGAFVTTPGSSGAISVVPNGIAADGKTAVPCGSSLVVYGCGGGYANVGGFTAAAQATPTVAASSHAVGTALGPLMTFSGLVRSTNLSGTAQRAVVMFNDTQTPSIDLILFSASPASSTITDNTAFALAAADAGKVIGVMHVTDCSAGGTPTICQAGQQAMPFVLPSNGASVYGALVVRAAITPGSTSDVTVTVTGYED